MPTTIDKSKPILTFSKIENVGIFTSDFRNFTERNSIAFSKEGMAIIYGPNGTGKTSLVNVLANSKNTSMCCQYDDVEYSSGADLFLIINDQNHRNIIQGSPKDFLIGANIQREYELHTFIEEEYPRLCKLIIDELKSKYFISSSSSKMIDGIASPDLKAIIKALTNVQNKGKSISIAQFISTINTLDTAKEIDYNADILQYILRDVADKNPIVLSVLSISIPGIKTTPRVREIEENSAALSILEQFSEKTQCIVCDTENIDSPALIEKKHANKDHVIALLTDDIKTVIEKVLAMTKSDDPLQIKNKLLSALDTGSAEMITNLQHEIKVYQSIAIALMEKFLKETLQASQLELSFREYQQLIEQKPDVTEEDFLYIEEIIGGSMRKELKVGRDDKKNIKIFLADAEFLGQERDGLHLSSGEQNFLSLAFEFLRAKNSPQPIVVIDDPISSFDSIYKNKVVYAIAKILENKQRMILTHNIDVVRLLDSQYSHSFKMYLLNNTENEINGFIPLKFVEQDILINLDKLLGTFRTKIFESIVDKELYLISMIPFMRGYARICNKTSIYDELTNVMHGYKTESVNIAQSYHNLFDDRDRAGNRHIQDNYVVNVDDILRRTVDSTDIIDSNKYPILNKTLKHTFIYLTLRLLVERTLVNKFPSIDTTKYTQLGQIIDQAFSGDTDESKRLRVKLTSKKTLINEFNHFEGNLSIFQPAIDITDTALNKEKSEILSLIERVKVMSTKEPNAQE